MVLIKAVIGLMRKFWVLKLIGRFCCSQFIDPFNFFLAICVKTFHWKKIFLNISIEHRLCMQIYVRDWELSEKKWGRKQHIAQNTYTQYTYDISTDLVNNLTGMRRNSHHLWLNNHISIHGRWWTIIHYLEWSTQTYVTYVLIYASQQLANMFGVKSL